MRLHSLQLTECKVLFIFSNNDMNNDERPYCILGDIGVACGTDIHEHESNVSEAMSLQRSHGSHNSQLQVCNHLWHFYSELRTNCAHALHQNALTNSVLSSGQRLIEAIGDIPSSIEMLDLSSNDIMSINSQCFSVSFVLLAYKPNALHLYLNETLFICSGL